MKGQKMDGDSTLAVWHDKVEEKGADRGNQMKLRDHG